MEKRYQVFVSSTYEDLQEERKAVMQALLELDCIPAGMELFPASSEEQWSLIKRVIDDSDYYVLILAGRYGSCNDEGMGYTEMEYRYALEAGKPVISFLHRTPGKLPADKCEASQEEKEKLAAFRKLTQSRLVKYWTGRDNLALAVTASMAKLPKQFPAVGWVRADQAADPGLYRQLAQLQQENKQLYEKLELCKTMAPIGTKDLAQGEDPVYFISCWVLLKDPHYIYSKDCSCSWNKIFMLTAPHMLSHCSENKLSRLIAENSVNDELDGFDEITQCFVADEDFQRIKVQFMALGLIRRGKEPHSWKLTEYGEQVMINLLAERRVPEDEREEALV